MTEPLESWRKTFRVAAPLLSDAALAALETALVTDDKRLIQGATTSPPPLPAVADYPVEAACLLGFCGAIDHGGFGVATVAETEEAFSRYCFDIDTALGEPSGVRNLLNPFDEMPRDAMIASFLPEVRRESERRRNDERTREDLDRRTSHLRWLRHPDQRQGRR
jgi:hypothetical protein